MYFPYNFIFLISVMLILAFANGSNAETEDLAELVPHEVNGWKAKSKDQTFVGKSIFKYIDGAGEVYLAYGFRKVLVRRFSKLGEPDIIVELFDMGSSNDAYGAFSHDREIETNEVGQGSEHRGGLLSFWKDKYLVTVFAEGESRASQSTILDLSKLIAKEIKDSGEKPELLNLLPTKGQLTNSIRYFHTHSILNYHYYLSEDNILNLSERTECVLAKYEIRQKRTILLLVRYFGNAEAEAAYNAFIKYYLPEAKVANIAQTENGKWTALRKTDQYLAIVFDAPNDADALSLLNILTKRLEER